MTDVNKGNPVSPDGAKSSLLIDQWQPHGLAYFITSQGGLISLQFWNLDQLKQMKEWADKSGLVSVQPNVMLELLMTASQRTMTPMDLQRTNGTKPEYCGDCGSDAKILKDKNNRGWYCGNKVRGKYCGWQSWK